MPLLPLDADTGKKLPRSQWSEGDRQSFIRDVCNEQKVNLQTGAPVDTAALDDAQKLAGSDAQALRSVRDVRTLMAASEAHAAP